MKHPAYFVSGAVFLMLGFGSLGLTQKKAAMMMQATGPFDVKLSPQTLEEQVADPLLKPDAD
ncbi:MAG: hypothetical protein ABJF23_23660 [Bryobacteraceae bacterium]